MNQVAVGHVIHRQALDDSQRAVVLVQGEGLLDLFLPRVRGERSLLQLVLDLLRAEDAQCFGQRVFGTIGDGQVLLFDFLSVEDLGQPILNDFTGGLIGAKISIGSSELHIVEDAPVQVLHRGEDKVVIQAEDVEG